MPYQVMQIAPSLADLKAAPITDISILYDTALFSWTLGDFTGRADDFNIVKRDNTALTVGAWVRQSTGSITNQQAGSNVLRTAESKLREVSLSITDFGAISGNDIITAVDAALVALGSVDAATLTIPKGSWIIGAEVDWSAYRNVTLDIQPGAIISHSNFDVTLPERVNIGLGGRFLGSTGVVNVKNKDVIPLIGPGAPGDGYVQTGNHAMGVDALKSVGSGTNNFAWGWQALMNVTFASDNIAIGPQAGKSITGLPGNTHAFGTTLREGDGNILIGTTAGRDITTGYENTFIGAYSGQRQRTGRWNMGLGPDTLILNQSGECNIAIGPYALVTASGSNNLAIGFAVMENQVAGSNVGLGHVALGGSVTSTRNVAIGPLTMQLCTDGYDNVAVGQEAMKNVVHPQQNTVVGSYACGSSGGTLINATAVGYLALLTVSGVSNTAIGVSCLSGLTTEENCFGIGVGAAVTGSNQGQLGNTNVTTYHYGLQARSDARDKADIRDTVLGLDFITALRPVDFRWDRRDEYREEVPPIFDMERPTLPMPRNGSPTYEADLKIYKETMALYDAGLTNYRGEVAAWAARNKLSNVTDNPGEAGILKDGSKKRSRFHHGFIAQEVKGALDALGIDFGGYQDHSINGGDDVLSLGYEELIAPLVKAVQELNSKVVALQVCSDAC